MKNRQIFIIAIYHFNYILGGKIISYKMSKVEDELL